MTYYVSVLKNYVGFTGRARRAEFWQFVLVNFIIGFVLDIIDIAIKNEVLGGIYSLAVLLPSLAVTVRRLHDTDRSGFWIFFGLIPLAGIITLIVFWCQDGTPGANRHGASPKAVGGPAGAGQYRI